MKSFIAVSLLALVAPICAVPYEGWSFRYHKHHSSSDYTLDGTSHHLRPTGLPILSLPVGPPFPFPTGGPYTERGSEFPTGGPTAGPYPTASKPRHTRPFGPHPTGTTSYVKERRALQEGANNPKSPRYPKNTPLPPDGSLSHGRFQTDEGQIGKTGTVVVLVPSSVYSVSATISKSFGTSTLSFLPSPIATPSSGTPPRGALTIPAGCLTKNSIPIGWLPDDGLQMSSITSDLGAKPCFYGEYSQITSSTYDDSQLTHRLSDILSSGAIFIPSIMPSVPFSQITPDVASQVAASMEKFTAKGIEVWLRFAHEMNYYVSDGTYHGTAEEFTTAWKNIAAAVKSNPNVKMYWSPNNVGGKSQSLIDNGWWPGPDTVDIVGIDIYPKSRTSFADAYKGFHDTFAQAFSKPFVVGETGWGSGDADDDKQYWLEQMISPDALSSCPKYAGFSWFEYNKDGDDFRVVTGDQDIAKSVLG